jgi:hypothetical protein
MHHVRPFLSHRPDGLIVPDPPLLSTPATPIVGVPGFGTPVLLRPQSAPGAPRVMPRAPRAGSPLKDPKHTL